MQTDILKKKKNPIKSYCNPVHRQDPDFVFICLVLNPKLKEIKSMKTHQPFQNLCWKLVHLLQLLLQWKSENKYIENQANRAG